MGWPKNGVTLIKFGQYVQGLLIAKSISFRYLLTGLGLSSVLLLWYVIFVYYFC